MREGLTGHVGGELASEDPPDSKRTIARDVRIKTRMVVSEWP